MDPIESRVSLHVVAYTSVTYDSASGYSVVVVVHVPLAPRSLETRSSAVESGSDERDSCPWYKPRKALSPKNL
eukprot:6214481-Pleurochrysis_carterae.AAC.3